MTLRLVDTSDGSRWPAPWHAVGEEVLWIAEMGGYTRKSSGGPPGAIVLARGLQRVEVLVGVLADGWEP